MTNTSVLTKSQTKQFVKTYNENGNLYKHTVTVRYDDHCGNGHNSFSITSDIRENGLEYMGGCCHDEIAKRFPELAHLIKWHLVSSDEPMYYIANSMYHADQHEPNRAWVYFTGSDPLDIQKDKERILGYVDAIEAKKAEGQPGYRVEWDEKTRKIANLDHARSSAVWPDAELSDFTEAKLKARLPALQADFRAAVESLGFTF